MSNDHTDDATITPDAKPNNVFCNRADISSFIMNTKAEPSIVPNSGIRSPMIIVVVISVIVFYLLVTMQRLCKTKTIQNECKFIFIVECTTLSTTLRFFALIRLGMEITDCHKTKGAFRKMLVFGKAPCFVL